ncbi:uncharacterized protein LOC118736601 isoform X1 [Rhagoletis pomonella]|uniref:uncharacterized protein LOC118736601 isoform X1 n=1 Tax=Rhagoletis pomonella TaxID=28610 RepID=UPI0017814A1B|nr:uncharacterized protein LOC118736601 isoform X1 [Rhagoletis pomonella]
MFIKNTYVCISVRLAPKPRKRRLAWAEDGEVAILDLWEERVADLRGARKNGHIYAEMANELAKLGHNYSARDVQVKLANFTQRYRKEKLAMGPSGGSPSTWPLYARVHQIIGGFKANMFCELTLENISGMYAFLECALLKAVMCLVEIFVL